MWHGSKYGIAKGSTKELLDASIQRKQYKKVFGEILGPLGKILGTSWNLLGEFWNFSYEINLRVLGAHKNKIYFQKKTNGYQYNEDIKAKSLKLKA